MQLKKCRIEKIKHKWHAYKSYYQLEKKYVWVNVLANVTESAQLTNIGVGYMIL